MPNAPERSLTPSGKSAPPALNSRQDLSWQDKAWALRDRLIGSPRFQRWAASFPLTRPIARRQAQRAFDLCSGFVYSQILAACIEIDLLEKLRAGALTTRALADDADIPLQSMQQLLAAAAALKLVSARSGDRWGLGMTGGAIASTPGLADMIRHHKLLYADLAHPLALLRDRRKTTKLGEFWPYARSASPSDLAQETVSNYSTLMTQSQAMINRDIIDAYTLSSHKTLLDVGGGEGAFLAAVAVAAPKLNLTLLDLPPVIERARAHIAELGLGDRVVLHGGDFHTDPLPAGADLITLVRILHDHDDAAALHLLKKIRAALPRGGRLLLAEPMAATRGAEAVGDAYFGFYLLAMGSGRPRSAAELEMMLKTAGFRRSRMIKTARPMLVNAIISEA